MEIHPTAVVHPKAELAQGVTIGPYAIIHEDVVIGAGTEIMAHAYIDRYARLGAGCRVFPSASVGTDPQDITFGGERTETIIGDRVVIREFVTINRGTGEGNGQTAVGDGSILMAYSHVGHDCHLGRNVVLVNNAVLAGHVSIEDEAVIGGMTGIHQFVRVGTHAFVGAFSKPVKDVPPYMLGQGVDHFKLHGPNSIGLRRKGFSRETISALKEAFRLIFRSQRVQQEALEEALAEFAEVPEVRRLAEFIRATKRGVSR